MELLVAQTHVVERCKEAKNRGNEGPTEQEKKKPFAGLLKVELMRSHAAQEQRKHDCDGPVFAAFGGCRNRRCCSHRTTALGACRSEIRQLCRAIWANDKSHDCSLFLFRLSTKLTDRRALTDQRFKTPRHQSQAQTAVRCSAVVRRRDAHDLKSTPAKISDSELSATVGDAAAHPNRPRMGTDKNIREIREIRGPKIPRPTQPHDLSPPPNVRTEPRRKPGDELHWLQGPTRNAARR